MSNTYPIQVPLMADKHARGESIDFLFWVGCAGAYDDRYKKVTRAFTKILHYLGARYAVLGSEETCTGDPARRAGNEMLFQMQAMQVTETLNGYGVKKIVTCCPHCYNTFKNEYPDLGGHYEAIHHTQYLQNMMQKGILQVPDRAFRNTRITFHDPCYLGRGNDEYEAPRQVLNQLSQQVVEMERNKSFALCCGAGGAQMFKEAEPGNQEVYDARTREALHTGAQVVATACPFCMTMLSDGIKYQDKQEEVQNLDIAELIAQALEL